MIPLVYSAEVENVLMKLGGVSEVAVIGVPDDEWGEAVHALVVPKDGARLDAQTVIDHCKSNIAGYKCPRTVDIRTEALPKSGAGKIQKFELREPFWKGRDRQVS